MAISSMCEVLLQTPLNVIWCGLIGRETMNRSSSRPPTIPRPGFHPMVTALLCPLLAKAVTATSTST